MSFKDEINKIKSEFKPKYYTDDEVYEFLIKKVYKHVIKDPIKDYFTKNPEAEIYSNKIPINFLRYQVFIDEKDFINYRNDSKIYYKKERDSDGYDFQHISFNELLKDEKKGFFSPKTISVLTPLGERVLNDIKAMAKNKDNIEIEREKDSSFINVKYDSNV